MKIAVGYDGSNAGREALRMARRCASAFQASVDVITSMSKGTESEQEQILQAEKGLEYAKTVFEKERIPCDTHLMIRGMSPGEDLAQFVDENSMDLLVVGVKRRSKVGKLLMGSTAQYVILKSQCPVLTVK